MCIVCIDICFCWGGYCSSCGAGNTLGVTETSLAVTRATIGRRAVKAWEDLPYKEGLPWADLPYKEGLPWAELPYKEGLPWPDLPCSISVDDVGVVRTLGSISQSLSYETSSLRCCWSKQYLHCTSYIRYAFVHYKKDLVLLAPSSHTLAIATHGTCPRVRRTGRSASGSAEV